VEKAGWLDHFGRYDLESPPTIFKRRVLICDYYTRNPRIFPLPFHWSDWVFFGETQDINDIFDLPLMGDEEAAWFESHPRRSFLFRYNLNRYLPEQWLCANFLRKHRPLDFDCFYDATRENIEITERFLAENTVILDKRQWGLRFVKYNPGRYLDGATLLHFKDWRVLYRKYALGEKGAYWPAYRLRAFLKSLPHCQMRSWFVMILGRLGLKEPLRAFMSRGGQK